MFKHSTIVSGIARVESVKLIRQPGPGHLPGLLAYAELQFRRVGSGQEIKLCFQPADSDMVGFLIGAMESRLAVYIEVHGLLVDDSFFDRLADKIFGTREYRIPATSIVQLGLVDRQIRNR